VNAKVNAKSRETPHPNRGLTKKKEKYITNRENRNGNQVGKKTNG
jgi:hypothetical protein